MDDFNTALMTEMGDLLMSGPSIQWFAALGDLPVKWTLEYRSANPGINEGDIFFHNDVWVGCTHAMDVGMFAPIFWDGRIFAWTFSQCHAGDVGGPMPGSFNPLANDLYEEPVLVSPIKLVREGELQLDVLEMHTRKSRTPSLLALQMRSQMAGINTVQTRMAQVLAEYGPRVVKGAMRRMIKDCSQAVGQRLLRIPDGEWRERIYMGGLGPQDRSAHRFETCITKTGDQLVITNEGTDPQYMAASGTYSTWRSGVVVAVSNFLAWDQMLCNAGALDHVTMVPVPGTLNVAEYPAATTGVGGTVASVYLSSFVVSKMLMSGPEDLQKRANAAGGQSVCSFWFGAGLDRNGRFVVQPPGDVVAGALGAFPHRDGVDVGGAWWWPNNPSGNAEEWESALPILYLYRREHSGAGGAGRWRGGNSLESAFLIHKTDEMMVQLVSLDHAVNCAIGLGGGLPGHPGDYRYKAAVTSAEKMRAGWLPGTRHDLEAAAAGLPRVFAKDITMMHPGDVFVAQYCGGGGFGDRLTRDPGRVAADVKDLAIDRRTAEEMYGVVLDEHCDVDDAATASCRAEMRRRRLADAKPMARAVGPKLQRSDVAGSFGGTVVFEDPGAITPRWACPECLTTLGPVSQNYKSRAAILERLPQQVNPEEYLDPREFCDDDLVIREYLCPSCGRCLAVELCRPSDPPVVDVRLARDVDAAP
jgi:N-methylhydantoinase B